MKLNIKANNENGKLKSITSSEFIEIDIYKGNKKLGYILINDTDVSLLTKTEEGDQYSNHKI